MTWYAWLMVASQAFACGAAIWFAAAYGRVHFERTPEGRNIMEMSVALVATSGTAILAEIARCALTAVLAAISWSLVGVVLVARHRIRMRAEAAWTRDHPETPDVVRSTS